MANRKESGAKRLLREEQAKHEETRARLQAVQHLAGRRDLALRERQYKLVQRVDALGERIANLDRAQALLRQGLDMVERARHALLEEAALLRINIQDLTVGV